MNDHPTLTETIDQLRADLAEVKEANGQLANALKLCGNREALAKLTDDLAAEKKRADEAAEKDCKGLRHVAIEIQDHCQQVELERDEAQARIVELEKQNTQLRAGCQGCDATVERLRELEVLNQQHQKLNGELREALKPLISGQSSPCFGDYGVNCDSECEEYEVCRMRERVIAALQSSQPLVKQAEPTDCQPTEAPKDNRLDQWLFLRPEVQWFALHMENMLRKNDYKGGWQSCSTSWLYARLAEECNELAEALHKSKSEEVVLRESADVANFAMMVADNYQRRSMAQPDAQKGEA